MASNFTDLNQSILNKGRKDKFRVVLNVPPVLRSLNNPNERENELINLNKLQFSPIDIRIPGTEISAIGIPFGGQTPHVTSQTRSEYPNVRISFHVDNNYDNYHFLWTWLTALNHPKTGGMDPHFDETKLVGTKTSRFGSSSSDTPSSITYKHIEHRNSFADYQTPITVYGLREYNEPIVEFTYTGAFITALGDIDYNFSESDEIPCYFDFAYSQVHVKLLTVRPAPPVLTSEEDTPTL
jgi:hypothetical protein